MEIKKVIVNGKELEYVARIELDEYETNMPEIPIELEDTMDLNGVLPKKNDEMEDTIPILEVKNDG